MQSRTTFYHVQDWINKQCKQINTKGVHETILTKIMQIPSLWHGTRYFNWYTTVRQHLDMHDNHWTPYRQSESLPLLTPSHFRWPTEIRVGGGRHYQNWQFVMILWLMFGLSFQYWQFVSCSLPPAYHWIIHDKVILT